MENLPIGKAFTLIEPGPVVLVTTHDGHRDNVMTISWTMVLDFAANFAITTGGWNHSYAALTKTKACVIAIPTVDLLDTVVRVGTCSGKDTDKLAKFGRTRVKAGANFSPIICRDRAAVHHYRPPGKSRRSDCSRAPSGRRGPPRLER
jgi:flavin reductase (DIM6/NTAB) family NADH-FMN oxidoreductase RutF